MDMWIVCLMDDGMRGQDMVVAAYETLEEAKDHFDKLASEYGQVLFVPDHVVRKMANSHCTN